MKTLRLLALVALATFTAVAAIDPFKVIPELTLNNGTVLHHVQIVSYSSDAVMAKWDGGRGTITNLQMPDELRTAVAPNQPAHKTTQLTRRRIIRQARPVTVAPAAPKRRVVSGKVAISNKDGGVIHPAGMDIYLLTERQKEAVTKEFNAALGLSPRRPRSNEQLYDAWKLASSFEACATTDAAGAFALELPDAGSYWIFAKVEISGGTNGEYYVWLRRVMADFPSQGMILNAQNSTNYWGLFSR